MSKYNPTQASHDRIWLQHQDALATIKDLSFKVKAYEKMLSEANITAVKEELRIRQLLEAYPPTVGPAREALEQLHEQEHQPSCECTLRAQHESALASV